MSEHEMLNTVGIPIIRERVDPIGGSMSLPIVESWDPAAPSAGPLTDLSQAARILSEELLDKLRVVARAPKLLVATDYDGTIAPIVDVPTRAYPNDASVVSMRALAALPATDVAVISGRSLRDLAAMSRLPREVQLVGSHGSEHDSDVRSQLDSRQLERMTGAVMDVRKLAESVPGLHLEYKPAGLAVHMRGLDPVARRHVEEELVKIAQRDGIFTTYGKDVMDLSVIKTSKGSALRELRARTQATTVVYIGDDTSDEKALATLGVGDLGVKVAVDPDAAFTAASFSVPNPQTVAMLLATIFDLRRAWLFGRGSVPIERHSMLGNGNSTALIDPSGRVCWMPHPLPHSASIFSEILGTEAAGYFGVAAASSQRPLSQRYLPGTMTLETRWPGLKSLDYLASVPVDSADTVLVRDITGDADAQIVFAPRLDYGTIGTRLEVVGDGVRVLGTNEPITLHAPGVDFEIIADGASHTARATVNPRNFPDGTITLTLICGGHFEDTAFSHPGGEQRVRREAEYFWSDWTNSLDLPTFKHEEVRRSALTLRALCHVPTGGVLAASTTSLPEGIGGMRNWDYRYCWLRDGSMTVNALLDLGSTAEAEGFLRWLGEILDRTQGPEQLHPLYAVDGSALTTEAVLEILPGYAGSRPVRVGNAAEHQVQLDVFGPVTELLDALSEKLGELSDEHWDLTCQMVIAVERRWFEADHGIWEARRHPKHNVYTKVMCWVTVDRAIRIAERHDRRMPGAWRRLRETIAEDVITRGFNEQAGAYSVAYDDPDLDSAALFIGLSGLLPPDDERFIATVDAVERELREGPTVFRYRYDDGLPGLEGGFHICTTWLIEAFILVGRIDDARDLFRRLDNLMGPTGLFSEEYDPISEVHLGNHPQAYSHLGYIRVARLFDQLGR